MCKYKLPSTTEILNNQKIIGKPASYSSKGSASKCLGQKHIFKKKTNNSFNIWLPTTCICT